MHTTQDIQPTKDVPSTNQKTRPAAFEEGSFRRGDQTAKPGIDINKDRSTIDPMWSGRPDDVQSTTPSEKFAKKDNLRHQVETRMSDLENELAQLKRDNSNSDRINVIQSDLKNCRDLYSQGWDRLTDTEQNKLNQWLKTSEPKGQYKPVEKNVDKDVNAGSVAKNSKVKYRS